MRAFITIALNLVFCAIIVGQLSTSCSVVAQMSPKGDSVLKVPGGVLFQNASINSTGFRFIINGNVYAMNQSINTSFGVGLTTVKLVAYNGTCTDTTVSYYFYPGQFPSATGNNKRSYGTGGKDHEMNGLTTLADGSNLTYGYREASSINLEPKTGILLKTKQSGCIEWARRIPATVISQSSITALKEAPDGNIYLLAVYGSGAQYLTKLNPSGNIIWSRSLHDGAGNYQRFLGLEVLPDGSVIALSTSPSFTSFSVTSFDINGQPRWQKYYDLNTAWTSNYKNLLFKDGFLYIGGSVGYNNLGSFGAFICKIDCSNGRTVWTKDYAIGASTLVLGDMVSVDSHIVLNILGPTGNSSRPVIGGIMKLDTAGAVIDATLIADIYVYNPNMGPYSAGTSRLTLSGKNYYIITSGASPLTLQGDGRSSKQIKLDSALNIGWVKSSGGIGQPRYYFNASAANGGSIIGGLASVPGLAAFPSSTLLQLVPVDDAGGNPNATCYFANRNWEIFKPTISVNPIQWTADTPAYYISELRAHPWADHYPEMRFNCPDYVDSCSFLKVSGPKSICNLAQPYVYKRHKNKACGQPINWIVSPGMQIVGQTDSTVSIQFLHFGRHVIYGRQSLGCVPVEDSIEVIAASKTIPPNLGNDRQICAGNTLVLRAGTRFYQYEWQDGTIDSVLTVSQPGIYWVKVKDSCNNIFSDTIQVFDTPLIPLTIGGNRTVCLNDTIHLTASQGFQNYQWSPPYQASATAGQSIIVNPLVDTIYTVIGEMSTGCKAYDTIRIIVNIAPPVKLGSDTSFCLGDSLTLDAGSPFATYAWNTGEVKQKIVVKNKGVYSVIASTLNGCKAYDTLLVLNVFNLPTPKLDNRTFLCNGDNRVLNAGNGFSQYHWSTGETTPQITVKDIGNYFVVVTDDKGCKGGDTAKIKSIQPTPSSFLPADILICSHESAILKSMYNYSNYYWSSGDVTQSIKVNSAGQYWLQVTDQFGCQGKDSIVVSLKNDCISGVFVPSAFTPNGDGKNDLLKPLIYGTLRQYSFKVFNRWGAIVFQSSDPSKGWDGKLNGLGQDGGTFIWNLTYQLDSQPVRQLKGTAVLVR